VEPINVTLSPSRGGKQVVKNLSIISTFKFQVLARSLLMVMIFSFIFFKINDHIIFMVINFLIGVFCTLIFITSSRENMNDFKDCLKRIENITSIHTTKL